MRSIAGRYTPPENGVGIADWGLKLAIRTAGIALHAVGGMKELQKASDYVENELGHKGVSIIDSAFNGIGTWAT